MSRGSITEDSDQRAERTGKGLHAYLTIEEQPSKGTTHEEMIGQISRELRRRAGGKQVHWKYIGNTRVGRECYVLVIDGKEEHRVP